MTKRRSDPADRRLMVALFAGAVVTGLAAGMGPNPLVNLAEGLLLGGPAGLAVWGVLTVAHHALGARS